MSGGELAGNQAHDYGGAMAVDTDAIAEIEGTRVTDNQATSGGAFYVKEAVVELKSLDAKRNAATGSGEEGGSGGLLHAAGSTSTAELSFSTVDACTAAERGGAVSASSNVASLRLEANTFTASEAGKYGGAIAVEGWTKVSIEACAFDSGLVKYIPEEVCLTLMTYRSTGNGWTGAQVRIYKEEDYVGDEVYSCPMTCMGNTATCDNLVSLNPKSTIDRCSPRPNDSSIPRLLRSDSH